MTASAQTPRPRSVAGLAALLSALMALGCLDRREGDTSVPREDCTICHGGLLEPPFEAAPPYNLSGEVEQSARGNGAHAAHLEPNDRARPVACADCHVVPNDVDDPGHVDSGYPVEVEMLGVARAFSAQPEFVQSEGTCRNTFCHGGYFVAGRPSGGSDTEPLWTSTDAATAACGGCHGMPPPPPHENVSECSTCHMNIRADRSFSRPDLHVDGIVTFYLPGQRR